MLPTDYNYGLDSVLKLRWIKLLAQPDVAYFCIALVFGLAFLVVAPPGSVPDEPAHLQRTFWVAQGDLTSSETKLPPLERFNDLCRLVGVGKDPQYLKPQFKKFIAEKGSTLQTTVQTVYYPPVPYIPAAISVKLLSGFTPNTAFYLYSARLATFLSALILTLYAIRIIPYGRWMMVVLALLPTRLYLMASFSSDAITSALALLWVALILSCLMQEETIPLKKILLLGVIATALAFSKPMYTFLLLLFFVLPFNKIAKKSWLLKVCLAVIILGIALKIGLMIKHLPIPASIPTQVVNSPPGAGWYYHLSKVNPSAQMALLMDEPSRVLSVVVRGFFARGQNLLRGITGLFGWGNIYLKNALYVFGYLLLFLSVFLDQRQNLGIRFRGITLSLFLFSFFLLSLAFYVFETPVGARTFNGFHGKYFIPFIPLLFLAIGCKGHSLFAMRLARLFVVIGLVVILSFSLLTVYRAYYCIPPAGGILSLTARASATGIAWVLVQETKSSKWRNKGIIDFIPSANELVYECILPAQPVNAIKLSLATSGIMNVSVHDARVTTLDGRFVRKLDLDLAQRVPLSASKLIPGEGKRTTLVVDLNDKQSSGQLVFGNAPFDLSQTTIVPQ